MSGPLKGRPSGLGRTLGRPARPRRATPGGSPLDHTRDTALYTALYYTDLYIAAVFTAWSAAWDTACTWPLNAALYLAVYNAFDTALLYTALYAAVHAAVFTQGTAVQRQCLSGLSPAARGASRVACSAAPRLLSRSCK